MNAREKCLREACAYEITKEWNGESDGSDE